MKNTVKHILSSIGLIIFLFIAYGSEDETSSVDADISTTEPVLSISAKKLYSEYEANEVAADLKYKGKVIEVTGIVRLIDRGLMDEIYVTLKGNEYFGDIQCFFSESRAQEAAALKKGSKITIIGLCDGQMMNVLLKGSRVK